MLSLASHPWMCQYPCANPVLHLIGPSTFTIVVCTHLVHETPSFFTMSQVEKGATAAVFGLGTIGLAVVDALRDAGAKRIIGVDTDPCKYERAKTWGATDLINPKDYDKPIQVCHERIAAS